MTKLYSIAAGAALTVASLMATGAQAVTLIGNSIFAEYNFPNLGTTYGGFTVTPSQTFTVGAGVEATGTVDGFATQDFDFGASSLTITFTTGVGWSGASFNGWVFDNLSNNYGTVLTVSGVAFSNVTVTGNELAVNWQGQTFNRGDQVVVTFGAVPEPASWALMIAGFGMVGGALRSRRTLATA